MAELQPVSNPAAAHNEYKRALSLAREVIREYHLTDLQPLLNSAERQSRRQYLNVAVFGRFKAGKSTFLNHLLGRPILPVGVVPVTSVVTEICYAPQEFAEVIFQQNGNVERIALGEVRAYISESENPENRRGVEAVCVFVPEMAPYQQLRLVDTPGLESILAHNAAASLAWSPNTDLALVAISVDPPLTQQDISLIERLRRFTPNVSVLLTKIDLLSPAEQQEVLDFVTSQLRARFPGGLEIFPYSVKPGYEELQERVKKEHLAKSLGQFEKGHAAAISRKLQTLLSSAAGYLELARKSAERKEQEREQVREEVLGSPRALADTELQFRLLARHASARTRPFIETRLQQAVFHPLCKTLEGRLEEEFPSWPRGFAPLLNRYEEWLRAQLRAELSATSAGEHYAFLEPLEDFQRQCQGILQKFRDQIAEKISRLFGMDLQTTETEIEVVPPRAPDISVGRIFDHNWELVSALIPMFLVRNLVRKRFGEKVESEVFKNLSRLTSQWEESINTSIRSAERESLRRFEELVQAVRHLLSKESVERSFSIQNHLHELRVEIESLSPRQDHA
ncbi:MAG TPA: dynamin family protein [Candidatus Acidoferrum sp.]